MKDSTDSPLPMSYSLRLLESILNAGNDYVCVKDREGRFVYSNSLHASLYKAKPGDLIGKTIEPWMGRAEFLQWHREDLVVLNSGQRKRVDPRKWTGKDGITRWYDSTLIPFADDSGATNLLLVIHRDITALMEVDLSRQALEEKNAELKKTAEELTLANRELESFSYSVSHDLRSPIRTIDGYSQLVLQDFGELLPAKGQRYLQKIHEGSQQMGKLIDDLLSFSRLSRTSLKKQTVATDKLVHDVIEALHSERKGRQIEIRIGDLPFCQGDAALLKQVWINLLSNALKYTRLRSSAVVEIGCLPEQNVPVFFVRDNGVGFDMQYVDKLFGVFQRLHRAEEFEGTGVGLATVQRIVHRHGGRIWAEAAPDRGASFYFSLTGEAKL